MRILDKQGKFYMKPLLLTLITLPLLFTSAAYACDAHHDAHSQAAKQTITAKYKAKIQPAAATKVGTVTT